MLYLIIDIKQDEKDTVSLEILKNLWNLQKSVWISDKIHVDKKGTFCHYGFPRIPKIFCRFFRYFTENLVFFILFLNQLSNNLYQETRINYLFPCFEEKRGLYIRVFLFPNSEFQKEKIRLETIFCTYLNIIQGSFVEDTLL